MTRPVRTEIENVAIKNSTQILKNIYGDFTWIEEITDSPDAAIKTNDGKIVGIEIVQIDNEEFLKHSNTWRKRTKTTKNIQSTQTRLHLIPEEIGKRICIKKNHKLSQYKKIRAFDQFIIILANENIQLTNNNENESIMEHFLYALEGSLIRNRLNFEKSIITNIHSGATTLVTDGKTKKRLRPAGFIPSDWRKGNHYIDRTDLKFIADQSMTITVNTNPEKSIPA